MLSYLTNRTQTIKIESTFSYWTNTVKGIPQVSILGQLIFNISINYLFFFLAKHEICYSADSNSLYSCGMNLDNIFTNLMQDTLQIGDIATKSVSCYTYLNTIDLKLNFKEHINNRKKACNKLYALRCLRIFLTQEKAKILACSMRGSQFLCLFNVDVMHKNKYMQRFEKVQLI